MELESNRVGQRDILSRLPAELQCLVWSSLTYPADRLMLALTCKSHAWMFERLKGNGQKSKSTKKSPRSAAGLKDVPKPAPASKRAPTKTERIHVLYRLQAWMPHSYRLCYECLRFRRRVNNCKFKPVSNFPEKGSWSGRAVTLMLTDDGGILARSLKESIKYAHRCPECCVRAHLNTIAHKKEHKQLRKELAALM